MMAAVAAPPLAGPFGAILPTAGCSCGGRPLRGSAAPVRKPGPGLTDLAKNENAAPSGRNGPGGGFNHVWPHLAGEEQPSARHMTTRSSPKSSAQSQKILRRRICPHGFDDRRSVQGDRCPAANLPPGRAGGRMPGPDPQRRQGDRLVHLRTGRVPPGFDMLRLNSLIRCQEMPSPSRHDVRDHWPSGRILAGRPFGRKKGTTPQRQAFRFGTRREGRSARAGARGVMMSHDKNETIHCDRLSRTRPRFVCASSGDARRSDGACSGAHGADLSREGKGLAREANAERGSLS